MEPRRANSSVIMSHSVRTVLRCFICILISVVMLIMRHCFLFPNVFVLPLPVADFASKKTPESGNKDEIFTIIFATNRKVKKFVKINLFVTAELKVILSDNRNCLLKTADEIRMKQNILICFKIIF